MKRTQIAWVFLIIIPVIIVSTLYAQPDSLITLLVAGILALALLLFYKLTIKVSDDYVRFSFGIGLIHLKFRMDAIEQCQSIRYFPLGWGIRFRPGVILYNVSGNKAIELKLKNKRTKIWIGTNSPDELTEYIKAHCKTA